MKLLLQGHDCRYAVEQLALSLFPNETIEVVTVPVEGDVALSALREEGGQLIARTVLTLHGCTSEAERALPLAGITEPLRRQLLRQSLYEAALPHLKQAPAWGALSGVRPTKLTTRVLLSGGTEEEADALLRDSCFVSPERRQLCLDASGATVEAAQLLRPQDLSVYIGIPFCPTRCAYCSFISQAVGTSGRLIEPYLQALLQEVRLTGQLLRESGRQMRTLYIGGGTPTTLSAPQLRELLQAVRESFDLGSLIEFTVEGGRPDTLDAEKFAVLREGGCERLSINPQTMSDAVLALVGRTHSAEQIRTAYREARQAGFSAINMDLIAGLPGDTPDSFRDSLRQVIDLQPENITVHTLARKRSSELFFQQQSLPDDGAVAEMLDFSRGALRENGYAPYYLYRQKYMSGSFENIGWTKPGFSCLYNIYMMEELHSILSMGCGGVSKLMLPGGKLERFHNPKYPTEYLAQPDSVLGAKRAFFARLAAL